jgi:transcriptional regulator with GAF, ATPase, and Fis domain
MTKESPGPDRTGHSGNAGGKLPYDRLQTLFELSQRLGRMTDLQALLDEIVSSAVSCIGAERGLIILTGEPGQEHRTVASGVLEKGDLSFSHSIVEQTLAEGRTLLSDDLSTDQRFRDAESISGLSILSFVCTPLVAPGRSTPLGTLYVDQRIHIRTFTQDDAAFLEAFANLAAIAVSNASRMERLVSENIRLRDEARQQHEFPGIIGRSPAMQKVFRDMKQILDDDCTVLITGPSGSGKEQVARAIHENGNRKDRPFLAINCGALPENLLEAELFGSCRGAFTGAVDKRGLFEAARGGTVLLDEIQHTSQAMQIKLLRFLQDKEVRRVGGTESTRVDVRLICATNEDLREAIRQGRFRRDLYYRINIVTIELPALNERREDIGLLAQHFLDKYAKAKKKRFSAFDPDALDALAKWDWAENNVRELENEVERAVIFAEDGEAIGLRHLDENLQQNMAAARAEHEVVADARGRALSFEEFEKKYISFVLAQARGNRSEAARIMGIPRSTLMGKMRKLGMPGL